MNLEEQFSFQLLMFHEDWNLKDIKIMIWSTLEQ